MESIWTKNIMPPTFPALSENLKVDAAVIGGGICGILTAYFLQKEGLNVVLLEAETIGSGQTHLTTAKITCQHGLKYHKLLEEQGFTHAKCYADANRHAVSLYEKLIKALSINCFFEKLPSYLYTENGEGRELLIQEKSALLSLGIECKLQTVGHYSTLAIPSQAQFHPLLFLYALAPRLPIYEHTKAIKVKGHTIFTEKNTVTAENIVFACHYPFPRLPGLYPLKIHQERSYAIAVKPNSPQAANSGKGLPEIPHGIYYGIDENTPSIRSFQDMLILGGKGHRTGKNNSAFRYEALQNTAQKYFPGSLPTAQWSAQDCITPDGLPYVGRFSSFEPGWYLATGFQKWGMSLSMTAAVTLTDCICGRPSACKELFSPKRHLCASGWKALAGEVKQASISLSQSVFQRGEELDISLLPRREARILQINGQKTGVYRDENDKLHFVSTRCPHLGCQLSFNPEEKTWDCPCHGSRFDYTGALINNPALKDISKN